MAKFLKAGGWGKEKEAETSKTFRSFARNAFCSGAQRELNKKVSGVERIISVRVAGRILGGRKIECKKPAVPIVDSETRFSHAQHCFLVFDYGLAYANNDPRPLIIAPLSVHVIKVQGARGLWCLNASSRSPPCSFIPPATLRISLFLSLSLSLSLSPPPLSRSFAKFSLFYFFQFSIF